MEKSNNQIKLDVIRIVCGESVYHELVNILSSETVRFPSRIELRNKAILDDFKRQPEPLTPKELAEKYNLSLPQIYKITEKPKV